MGSTLITGASAGLGECFARAIAAEGRDLILVARRADRLDALAAELGGAHGVRVDAIACDLAVQGAIAALVAEVSRRGLTIETLINNAGFGARGAFATIDGAEQAAMVDVNCRVVVELCHAVLPAMIAARRGFILNLASTAAFQPGPWMSVYYASKAFVLSFSEGLHEEVRREGIHVTALCPGPTRTEFADRAGMGDSLLFTRLAGDPQRVVADGLRALAANRAVKVSGRSNAAMAASIRLTPRLLARRIAGALQRGRGAGAS